MVDSGENNAEITKIESCFFVVLHSTFGIYKFVTLSHKLIILPMHLVSFFLYKAMVP